MVKFLYIKYLFPLIFIILIIHHQIKDRFKVKNKGNPFFNLNKPRKYNQMKNQGQSKKYALNFGNKSY